MAWVLKERNYNWMDVTEDYKRYEHYNDIVNQFAKRKLAIMQDPMWAIVNDNDNFFKAYSRVNSSLFSLEIRMEI